MNILNYLKVSDLIHTSGQPKPEEFKVIRSLGVDTIINLSMPDSESVLPSEGELVTQNGMNYLHIPVVWTAPQVSQFNFFQTVMAFHKNKNIWVHCALNWRVASFTIFIAQSILAFRLMKLSKH